jgi:hypothetical protein
VIIALKHTGTGKTTMTIALLSILASTCSPRAFVHGGASLHDAAHVQRLLCTAPTNVAVQEIATRFVHTFLEGMVTVVLQGENASRTVRAVCT